MGLTAEESLLDQPLKGLANRSTAHAETAGELDLVELRAWCQRPSMMLERMRSPTIDANVTRGMRMAASCFPVTAQLLGQPLPSSGTTSGARKCTPGLTVNILH